MKEVQIIVLMRDPSRETYGCSVCPACTVKGSLGELEGLLDIVRAVLLDKKKQNPRQPELPLEFGGTK